MRLATYHTDGRECYGIVLRHPRDGTDWVFDPAAVESAARGLPALKGAGYTWWRPDFGWTGGWPRTLADLLAHGISGLDTLRRMQDFLLRYLEQADPFMLARAGSPLARVILQAPIPEPRLLLGAVGNNPGFLRMDPSRARNLQQPKFHQRTLTSLVGPDQPIVLPASGEQWAGTTELGLIIGRGGRFIAREKAREHIAGYTVVNDGLGSHFARRWNELDRQAGLRGRPHYHSANTASWLDKKADTMLAMGPWLVTPDEVGDPYDLLAFYRENGLSRNRGHTSALCTGIEEIIHWLSQYLTLEPGMVIHFGATSQDGLTAGPVENYGPGYLVECEIERVGVLRNPLVAPATRDWRSEDDPGRKVHPAPVVRKWIAEDRTVIRRPQDWTVGQARHFWTLLGNGKDSATIEGIEPRPYPLAYNAPASSLASSGGTVTLPPVARTLACACELGVVIKSIVHNVTPEEARRHLLGYVVLAVFRDSSFRDALIQPHILQASIPDMYSRWPEGFNLSSDLPVPLDDIRCRRMRLTIAGAGEVEHSTDAYLLDAAAVIAELSRGITLLPGDVIALGLAGNSLVLPADRPISTGTVVKATIEGIGEVAAEILDQRESAQSLESRKQS